MWTLPGPTEYILEAGLLIVGIILCGFLAVVTQTHIMAQRIRRGLNPVTGERELDKKYNNPSIEHIMNFFAYAHLPPALQEVSKPFGDLAVIIATGSSNPETTVALRKLLEAKDAAVRAHLVPKQ